MPIEHSNDANPTVWTEVTGHEMCASCALSLELDNAPCPYCRVPSDQWRSILPPQDNMDVDSLRGVAELFQSPQASPHQPPVFHFGASRDGDQQPPRRSPPRRSRGTLSHRPTTPTCQYIFNNKQRVCSLRGPKMLGTDGKLYCEAHLEDGPTSAQERAREQAAKDLIAVSREKSRIIQQKCRRAEAIRVAEQKAREAQRMLELQAQMYRE